ncbi:hypothetical protein HF283_17675, partial [Acidithiobacillus ferrooxidans]|nr:hypothetical protein [Acidithiobacillus ferrooxidans]
LLYGTGLAWSASTVIYQSGTFAKHPGYSAAWIAGVLAAFALLVVGLRLYGQRSDALSKPSQHRRASA